MPYQLLSLSCLLPQRVYYLRPYFAPEPPYEACGRFSNSLGRDIAASCAHNGVIAGVRDESAQMGRLEQFFHLYDEVEECIEAVFPVLNVDKVGFWGD